ncbi:PREDICTED: putative serine carboxypeptidase-like 52 [Theobroma cacao]|uniref:Serine carboxypeptidase-like 52 n=1 Tax=Theobroma cacao TaxID=3641 RepID=A0AB32WU70_THECC|nr:PREDICTED: putative serine carboxypeptidase-like 52 [Theobroma cacao]
MYARRRYLDEHQKELLDPEPPILPKIGCRIIPYSPLRNANYTYSFLLSSYWANAGNVQKAIHIRKGSIGQWKRCDFGLPYTADLPSSFLYHVNLSTRGYRALVYSGDHDMLVPFLGTEAWIKSLNYPIVDDWRPWMVQDQVAGYTRTYSNQMTYATIKRGGHTAPEYKPAECFAMFKRWISREPL